MLRQRTKATDMWVCAGVLLLAATGCGDDGGNMDGSVPEDGGPDAQMDADVAKDAGEDAEVDASGRDSGECDIRDSTIFYVETEPTVTPWDGLIVEKEEVCETCPENLQEGIAEVTGRDAGAGACPHYGSLISGCGFDVVVTLHSAYHFDADSGLLVGGERISDLGFQRGGCSAAELMFGERIPECPERTRTSLCDMGDGGVDAGPDASVDAAADSGMDSGTQ